MHDFGVCCSRSRNLRSFCPARNQPHTFDFSGQRSFLPHHSQCFEQNKLHNVSVPLSNSNFIYVKIHSVPRKILLDSGATRSCISSSFLKRLHLTPLPLDPSVSDEVYTADNTSLKILGQIELNLNINGLMVLQTFIVLPTIYNQCILGTDFLLQTKANIDFDSRIVSFYDGLTTLPLTALHNTTNIVRIAQAVTIPASCEAVVRVKLHRKYKPNLSIIEPFPNLSNKTFLLAKCLVQPRGSSTICKIFNPSNAPISLESNYPIATIEPINAFDSDNARLLSNHQSPSFRNHQSQPEFINSLSSQPDSSQLSHDLKLKALHEIGLNLKQEKLTQSEFEQLVTFLYKNRDLFATSLKDLPASDICYHTIETTTDIPVRQRPFRHPPHVENEIDKHCNELLDADIIEHSQSPYNNPVFLIKKSSGEYRFIVDFRKLNSITVPKFYQLPSLEQTIDQVGRLKPVLISSLDAKSGYYSLPLDPATAHKTAFSTRTSKFQFKRLCFGLQGSPSTYCMAMSKLLNSLHEQVVCYIDDALIMSGVSPSGNMTAHIAILQKVFNKFREAKLRFNAQKCQFAQTSVKYLGHVFGSDGIQIDTSKIEVIKTYEAPKNLKQLQSFLGLTNYWRRFICSYSAITQPLRELLKQGVPYVWGKEQEEAFQTLKEKLCTAPVLVYPDMTKPFRITSDASKNGLGYILSQFDSTGQERAISYKVDRLDLTSRIIQLQSSN